MFRAFNEILVLLRYLVFTTWYKISSFWEMHIDSSLLYDQFDKNVCVTLEETQVKYNSLIRIWKSDYLQTDINVVLGLSLRDIVDLTSSYYILYYQY